MGIGTIKTSLLISSDLWKRVKERAIEWAKENHLPSHGAISRWVASVLREEVECGVEEETDDDKEENKKGKEGLDRALSLLFSQLNETLAVRIADQLGEEFEWGSEKRETAVTLILGELGRQFEEVEK